MTCRSQDPRQHGCADCCSMRCCTLEYRVSDHHTMPLSYLSQSALLFVWPTGISISTRNFERGRSRSGAAKRRMTSRQPKVQTSAHNTCKSGARDGNERPSSGQSGGAIERPLTFNSSPLACSRGTTAHILSMVLRVSNRRRSVVSPNLCSQSPRSTKTRH